MDKIKTLYHRHPILANLLIIIITGIVLLMLAMLFLRYWTRQGEVAIVPQVKGLSYDLARESLAKEGLDIIISDSIYDRSLSPGTIVESWPKAGAEVKDGRPVYVTVTAFSPKMVTITMPVTGVSSRQATSYLQALGINSISVVKVPSAYSDLVIDATVGSQQLFVGASIPVTANVVLKVGSGMPSESEYSDSTSIQASDSPQETYAEESEDNQYFD